MIILTQIKILNELSIELNNIKSQYCPLTYYYIYVTFFSNGNFYIGSRKCNITPEDDISYLGSYTDKTNHDGEKVILKIFSNENEMIFYETSLIQKFKSYDNCINVNSSPRTSSPTKLTSNIFNTRDLMQIYGYSSPTTLTNWCIIANVIRFRQGKYFYITDEDKLKLDELSNYIKSGYTYEDYLKTKRIPEDEIAKLILKVKGVN